MLIELLDELVFGAREAAWPLIRHDLHLSYGTIGLLLALPQIGAAAIEPVIGVLADAGWRRLLVVGGGVVFSAALALTGVAATFPVLLVSFLLFYPASGAFVSLSQATLMDLDPDLREQNMALWTLAGSIGMVLGPVVLTAALTMGQGWRDVFLGFAALTVPFVILSRQAQLPRHPPTSVMTNVRTALLSLRRWPVLRWLVLLEAGDLMGDVLNGYLALYVVDTVGVHPAGAGIAVVVFTLAGLVGDALLLSLLRRVSGTSYLRVGALGVLVAYPAFLLVPGFLPKLALLAVLGVVRAGWYPIAQAGLYGEMPEASGTILVLTNVSGVLAGCFPLLFGVLASQAGLGPAMWLLMAGPAVIVALAQGGKGIDETRARGQTGDLA